MAFRDAGDFANLQGSFLRNAAATGVADGDFVVVNDATGFANFAAAEAVVQVAAVAGADTAITDYILVFFNTSTNKAEVYFDADSSFVGGETLIATLDNIGTAAGLNGFTSGNFFLF